MRSLAPEPRTPIDAAATTADLPVVERDDPVAGCARTGQPATEAVTAGHAGTETGRPLPQGVPFDHPVTRPRRPHSGRSWSVADGCGRPQAHSFAGSVDSRFETVLPSMRAFSLVRDLSP